MFSMTAEYALRAVTFLAQHHPVPKTTSDIAEATQVPSGYLSKIMQSLVRRELAHSQRGLGGGFTLLRDPDEITIYDVLTAIDAQPERIRKCPLGIKGHVKLCPLHRLMDDAVEKIEESFRGATLGSLLATATDSKPLCEFPDVE